MDNANIFRSRSNQYKAEPTSPNPGELGPNLHHLHGDQDHLIPEAGGGPLGGDPEADQQTRGLLPQRPESARSLPK